MCSEGLGGVGVWSEGLGGGEYSQLEGVVIQDTTRSTSYRTCDNRPVTSPSSSSPLQLYNTL